MRTAPAFGFFLRQLHDAHRDGKFMHGSSPATFSLQRHRLRNTRIVRWLKAASAAWPRLMPPSFGGTSRFVQRFAAPLDFRIDMQVFEQKFILEDSPRKNDRIRSVRGAECCAGFGEATSNSPLKGTRNFRR